MSLDGKRCYVCGSQADKQFVSQRGKPDVFFCGSCLKGESKKEVKKDLPKKLKEL